MIKLYYFLIFILFLSSCQKEEIPNEESQSSDIPVNTAGSVTGFYLLNEGNMSMNKASLDFVDFRSGSYSRNSFTKNNPDLVGGLGDVGNDLAIYGSKLYVVVNASNKVEVLDVNTGKRLKKIDIDNCRYIAFYKGKAYLSTYLGTIGDPNAPNGIVAEIDTTTLTITRRVEVGRQPEELVAHKGKIYVANSGGYSPPNYESTLSVIDIESFTEINRIEVAINLHRVRLDSQGDLYVTSRGDYYDIPSKLFVIDTQTEEIKKTFDFGVSNLCLHKGLAYMYHTEFSYVTGANTVSYQMLNTMTETVIDRSFIAQEFRDRIDIPYGIAVHPETDEVFITDAKDYVTPGTLFCFTPQGNLKWSVQTGDIPGHLAFKF